MIDLVENLTMIFTQLILLALYASEAALVNVETKREESLLLVLVQTVPWIGDPTT